MPKRETISKSQAREHPSTSPTQTGQNKPFEGRAQHLASYWGSATHATPALLPQCAQHTAGVSPGFPLAAANVFLQGHIHPPPSISRNAHTVKLTVRHSDLVFDC